MNFIGSFIALLIFFVPFMIFGYAIYTKIKRKYLVRKYKPFIKDVLSRHNQLYIGMSESEMLQTMNFRYDKSIEEDKTTYRFVFISRGGSGQVDGATFYGGIGGLSGTSEQHDESSVVVECKDNKVIKVTPYNLSNIQQIDKYTESQILKLAYELLN